MSKKTTHDERKEYMAAHGIWSQFKPILIKYYGEKCWYSECSLEGTFGEIDHFRPKNKSTDEKKMKYCQMDIGGWHTIISTIV